MRKNRRHKKEEIMKILSFCVLLFISESESKHVRIAGSLTKRSVFDIIPGSDFNKHSLGKKIVFKICWTRVQKNAFFTELVGTKCNCNNGAHHCIFDEQLRCRRKLKALSQSEDLQIREREVRHKRRESRRLFKRLLRKWMKENTEAWSTSKMIEIMAVI